MAAEDETKIHFWCKSTEAETHEGVSIYTLSLKWPKTPIV